MAPSPWRTARRSCHGASCRVPGTPIGNTALQESGSFVVSDSVKPLELGVDAASCCCADLAGVATGSTDISKSTGQLTPGLHAFYAAGLQANCDVHGAGASASVQQSEQGSLCGVRRRMPLRPQYTVSALNAAAGSCWAAPSDVRLMVSVLIVEARARICAQRQHAGSAVLFLRGCC